MDRNTRSEFGEIQIAHVFSATEDDIRNISANPISWVIGKAQADKTGLVLFAKKKCCSLPVEFWNHQLREVDFRNKNELIDFVEKWGIPYHPIRNDPFLTEEQKELSGIRETERRAPVFIPHPHEREILYDCHITSIGSPFLSFISWAELESSIRALQALIGVLVYHKTVMFEAITAANSMINYASCNPTRLTTWQLSDAVVWKKGGIGLSSRGLLTSAICNQIIGSFADDTAEWRTCACEGCERKFKRKQPENLSVRPDRDSIYCCKKCKDRQAKRNQRRAAKNRRTVN